MLRKRLHKNSAIEEPSFERTKVPKSADIRVVLEKKLARRVDSSAIDEEEKLSASGFDTTLSYSFEDPFFYAFDKILQEKQLLKVLNLAIEELVSPLDILDRLDSSPMYLDDLNITSIDSQISLLGTHSHIVPI